MNGQERLTDAEFAHSCGRHDCPDDHFHAEHVEAIVAARLASVDALADEWEAVTLAPLTDDDQPDGVRLRARSREAVYRWLARELRAVLGSDAHTEQKGTGE